MNKIDSVVVRDFVADDVPLIYTTFLKSLFYDDSWFSLIPKNEFMKNYHKVIEGILSNSNNKVNIACLKDDPNTILGYAILSKDETLCHFVFVKKVFRKDGIAKLLVKDKVKTVTHLTKAGLSLLKKKQLTFNPFLI